MVEEALEQDVFVEPVDVNEPDITAENEPLAEADTGEAAEPGDDAEPEPKRNRYQERIGELVNERDQERHQREALEAQVAQAQANQQQAGWQEQWQAQQPDPDQFETAQEYRAAHSQWHAAGVQAQQNAAAQAQQAYMQRQQAQQSQAALNNRLSDVLKQGQEQYTDYLEVIADPTAPKIGEASPAALQAVLESDQAAALSYYLGKNPKEITNLAGKTPIQAIRRIAQLEMKLQKSNPPGPITGHPPTKVRGSTGATLTREPTEISAWIKWKDAQQGR